MARAAIIQAKRDAVKEATDVAFVLMLAIPVMVVHDKYSKIMKKDGRCETFANMCLEMYDAFQQGYFTLEDCHEVLKEEAGISIVEMIKNGNF